MNRHASNGGCERALHCATLLLLLAGCALAVRSEANCRYTKFATLHVKFDNSQALLDGNGTTATMLMDTDSVTTTLSRGAVERLRLGLAHADQEFRGLGGGANADVTRVDEISFGPVRWRDACLLVVWSATDQLPYDALLGADFLFQNDIEISLAENQLRLFAPEECDHEFLGYWDASASAVALEPSGQDDLRPIFAAGLNGPRFRAMFDSGATTSFVDRAGAARVGVTVDSPETMAATP